MTALVLGIIATALSTASLTWQFALYSLSGPRVRAQARIGAVGFGGLTTSPANSQSDWVQYLRLLAQQGFNTPVLAVQAVNKGRMPVQVLSFGVEFSNGFTVSPIGDAISNTTLPHVLPPHSEATWAISMQQVSEVAQGIRSATSKDFTELRMVIVLAGDKKIYSAPVTFPRISAA